MEISVGSVLMGIKIRRLIWVGGTALNLSKKLLQANLSLPYFRCLAVSLLKDHVPVGKGTDAIQVI